MRIEIIFLLDLYHTEFLPNIIKSPADTEPCWNGRGMRGEGGGEEEVLYVSFIWSVPPGVVFQPFCPENV